MTGADVAPEVPPGFGLNLSMWRRLGSSRLTGFGGACEDTKARLPVGEE